MTNEASIYDDFEVPAVINAAGTKTRIGGSLIREGAVEAMADAAGGFARISDLQARASEAIAEATGAEAGYVTTGASAAMTLGAAACIARDDLGTMARLPETEEVADEIVMARTHRTGYDHAFRVAGADIVDVGTNDHHLGTGAANVEPWEFADAISEETAAVAYVQKPYTQPPLERVVEVAHEQGVPVIVDAAAELPPVENLERFVSVGVDLVAYSGGKAIRGPQSTGFLAGRADLIESVALQHLDMHAAEAAWEPPSELFDVDELAGVPRQGIGRGFKVGKEELVGFLAAFEAFLAEDHEAVAREWRNRSERVADELATVAGVETSIAAAEKTAVAPEVVVGVDPERARSGAAELVGALRREDPRVYVGADQLADSRFTINPMCLADSEADYVIERIRANLRS